MEKISEEKLEMFKDLFTRIIDNVSKVVVGKRKEIELILASMLADGHILIEGVPGVAKTLIARSIALSLELDFKRVQATPDLLPSDFIGTNIFDPVKKEFKFVRGPIFTNILFVDEINRAPPKTQSALLEAMQERQVTVEGVTYRLERPFIVIATMNPVEVEGTFPLPEAQVDRFLAKITIGYPDIFETVEILKRIDRIMDMRIDAVASAKTVLEAMELVKRVRVEENILKYIAMLIQAIRNSQYVRLGPSPRGAIAIYYLARSIALINGRDYVIPDDIKYVAHSALIHRVFLKGEARLTGVSVDRVVSDALSSVEVP